MIADSELRVCSKTGGFEAYGVDFRLRASLWNYFGKRGVDRLLGLLGGTAEYVEYRRGTIQSFVGVRSNDNYYCVLCTLQQLLESRIAELTGVRENIVRRHYERVFSFPDAADMFGRKTRRRYGAAFTDRLVDCARIEFALRLNRAAERTVSVDVESLIRICAELYGSVGAAFKISGESAGIGSAFYDTTDLALVIGVITDYAVTLRSQGPISFILSGSIGSFVLKVCFRHGLGEKIQGLSTEAFVYENFSDVPEHEIAFNFYLLHRICREYGWRLGLTCTPIENDAVITLAIPVMRRNIFVLSNHTEKNDNRAILSCIIGRERYTDE